MGCFISAFRQGNKYQLPFKKLFSWLSLKSAIEYPGEWEMLYNPDFNCTEFGTIKNAARSNISDKKLLK